MVSLVSQMVKNLPAMQETWVWSLGWEDPLETRKATHSGGVFPGSSSGKESTCNAGDPGSIPGSGRSAGKGICYPLQFSWASLVVQLVKNLLAMQETWVWSLGWEDPLEDGMATHSNILVCIYIYMYIFYRGSNIHHNTIKIGISILQTKKGA